MTSSRLLWATGGRRRRRGRWRGRGRGRAYQLRMPAATGVVIVLMSFLLGSCSAGSGLFSGPARAPSGPPVTYVSVTEFQPSVVTDVRGSWPQLLLKDSLPAWTTAYNFNLPTNWELDEAPLVGQIESLHPTVVTLALGLQDAMTGVSTSQFSAALRGLLMSLHAAKVLTVLVGNVLPLNGPQPAGFNSSSTIAAYNAAISSDSAAAGSVFVNLHAAFARALHAGESVMAQENLLTPLGQTLVAATFSARLKHHPIWR